MEAAPPNRIEGLLLRPVVDVKPAASWDEVTAMVRGVAPRANLLAAEIDGDRCTPLSSVEPSSQLALGSTFKLYILEALASQIAAGKHGWDETIAIDDALKSLLSFKGGFKGGSEPGVVNLTWLLRRARDGKWLFLSIGFNDPDNGLDEEKVIAAGTAAREFLSRSDASP